jgi:uncharacterized protein
LAVQFEWNKDKARRNFRKHDISFEEASTVFNDEMFISLVDDEHSSDEVRYVTIGMSDRGNLVLVAHTDRLGGVRIISARKATKNEGNFYAEQN